MNVPVRDEPFYIAAFAGTRLPVHTATIMPALVDPGFIPAKDATGHRERDGVLGVTLNGITRAYPLWIMDNYHVANDMFGDTPLAVIHCERCSSGVAFLATVDGRRLTFQVAGIWKMTLIIRDEQTSSFWSHSEGVALDGPLKGTALQRHPCYQTTWAEWRERHGDTEVLFWPENKLHRDGRHGHGARDYMGRPGIRAVPDKCRNTSPAPEKRRAALQRQLEGESADDLRNIGHLLLSRQRDVPKGVESVSLEGFDGSETDVRLDPRLDAIQNAERFYDRARRRERAARKIPGRLKLTTDRILSLEAGLETLRSTGPSDELWDLLGGEPEHGRVGRGARRTADDSPLPYRRYRSSGGLEIRVGRSSRANDSLTFRHSAPEDIWLHARQAAGAHVILRWERRDQNPPLADLTEAALLAALHSEARHSGMVAVDWTRRKYVRKPRKVAPGAVIPERVSTLFVEPDAAVAARLSLDD